MTAPTLTIQEVVNGVSVAETAVTVELAQAGPQGPPGPAAPTYTHNQGSPSATWTVNHNLGYRPAVELLTAGGAEMEGDVVHVSANQCLVYFVIAVAGSARLQ